jgi:hypothetical protein
MFPFDHVQIKGASSRFNVFAAEVKRAASPPNEGVSPHWESAGRTGFDELVELLVNLSQLRIELFLFARGDGYEGGPMETIKVKTPKAPSQTSHRPPKCFVR